MRATMSDVPKVSDSTALSLTDDRVRDELSYILRIATSASSPSDQGPMFPSADDELHAPRSVKSLLPT